MTAFFASLAATLTPIGWGAVGLVFALWLAIAFAAPGKTRELMESVAATALFVALLALFSNLVHDALRDERRIRMIAFGALWSVFTCSTLLSLVLTVQQARGAESRQASATN
jgi:hypothetical protein